MTADRDLLLQYSRSITENRLVGGHSHPSRLQTLPLPAYNCLRVACPPPVTYRATSLTCATPPLRRSRDDIRGFIGLTTFPDPPPTPHTQAVALSDVTYMFPIANQLGRPYWGVTANLVIKRSKGPRFLDCFPKTGGGEDVDLCIR